MLLHPARLAPELFSESADLYKKATNRQVVFNSQILAMESLDNLDADQELSVLLAVEAVKKAESQIPNLGPEAEKAKRRAAAALNQAVQASRIKVTLGGPEKDGHLGEVNAVAFSADGAMIATASGDKTVKVWHCTF